MTERSRRTLSTRLRCDQLMARLLGARARCNLVGLSDTAAAALCTYVESPPTPIPSLSLASVPRARVHDPRRTLRVEASVCAPPGGGLRGRPPRSKSAPLGVPPSHGATPHVCLRDRPQVLLCPHTLLSRALWDSVELRVGELIPPPPSPLSQQHNPPRQAIRWTRKGGRGGGMRSTLAMPHPNRGGEGGDVRSSGQGNGLRVQEWSCETGPRECGPPPQHSPVPGGGAPALAGSRSM